MEPSKSAIKENETNTFIRIVNVPTWKGNALVLGEWSFTFVMWSIWVYFIFPLINLFVWFFFGKNIYTSLIVSHNYEYFIILILDNLYLIFGIAVVIISWAVYNKMRFSRIDRRKFAPLCTPAELAQFFKIQEDKVVQMQKSKEIVMKGKFINR